MDTENEQSVGQTHEQGQSQGVAAVAAGSASSVRDLIRVRGCTPMGEYRCQVPMPINGRLCGIDYCIADIVAALNAASIRTVMSCCGHGDESIARIDLADGRALLVRGHSPNDEAMPDGPKKTTQTLCPKNYHE